MADRGDTHYRVPNLNRWFLISSLSCSWRRRSGWCSTTGTGPGRSTSASSGGSRSQQGRGADCRRLASQGARPARGGAQAEGGRRAAGADGHRQRLDEARAELRQCEAIAASRRTRRQEGQGRVTTGTRYNVEEQRMEAGDPDARGRRTRGLAAEMNARQRRSRRPSRRRARAGQGRGRGRSRPSSTQAREGARPRTARPRPRAQAARPARPAGRRGPDRQRAPRQRPGSTSSARR